MTVAVGGTTPLVTDADAVAAAHAGWSA